MTQHILEASNWLNIGGIFDFVSDIKKSLNHRAKVKATIKELQSLSDYELKDIGINRSMIRSIAEESHND